jgi:hypothetical protein
MSGQAVAGVIAAYAALFGGMYAVVTRPLLGRLTNIAGCLKLIEEKLDGLERRLQ